MRNPELLTPTHREQVAKILSNPAVFQYLLEQTISTIMGNMSSLEDPKATADYIRGTTNGTLLLLNKLIEDVDHETVLPE